MYGSINYNKSDDNIANYIKYLNNKLLDVIDNEDIWVYTKKRSGTRCTHCWDSVRRQKNTDDCEYCFGSGYEGGFNTPVRSRMSYLTFPEIVQKVTDVSEDRSEDNPINVWLMFDSKLEPGDVIVDFKNNRFIVDNIQYTNKNNAVIIRQILRLNNVPRDNIIYKLQIPEQVEIQARMLGLSSSIEAQII